MGALTPYWEPLLRQQIEDLVADQVGDQEILREIDGNVRAYRAKGGSWNASPTDTEVWAFIKEARLALGRLLR